MLVFLALSSLGLLLCIALHALSYAGIAGGWSRGLALGLFFGLFVVAIPATAVSLAAPRGAEGNYEFGSLYRAAPRWARWFLVAGVGYAIVCFAVVAVIEEGTPAVGPGALTLKRGETVLRTVTPAEFRRHQALDALGFSCLSLGVYVWTTVLFLGAVRQRRRERIESAAAAAAAAAATTTAISRSAVTTTGAPLVYGRAGPRLPIYLHHLLFLASVIVAFVVMPALVCMGLRPLLPGIVVLLLVGAVWLASLKIVGDLFTTVIAARCPNCGGRSYPPGREYVYICRDCGFKRKL